LSTFKFLHAADLHLDSPLVGLSWKSPEFAKRVEKASRQAFDNLVCLAIEEGCRFVVFAGDLFDRAQRHYPTGIYFAGGMKRLSEAGIDALIVLGNHDAGNTFAEKLVYVDKVYVFPKNHAKSKTLEDVGVAVHGRSFPRLDTDENLALDYPPPTPGFFNVGVLHTACAGNAGEHAAYAPCSIEQLRNHGYDYWALGHVHGFAVLSEAPHIVYPGNVQGRDSRETGAKGAVLVTVEDGRVSVEHRALDVVRWASLTIDATGHLNRNELIEDIQRRISNACEEAGDRALAVRLRVTGKTTLHHELLFRRGVVLAEVEDTLATLNHNEVWLEKFAVATESPAVAEVVDPTVAGQLDVEIRRLAGEGHVSATLEEKLVEIRAKLPASAHADDFITRMRSEMVTRATTVARSLIDEANHAIR
jgi:DNA repair protein SbcD/Mre11